MANLGCSRDEATVLGKVFTLEPSEVDWVLKHREQARKEAFLGDAVLKLQVRSILVECEPESPLGVWAILQSLYVSKAALQHFLLAKLRDLPNAAPSYGYHQAETLFEALLHRCYRTHGDTVVKPVVAKLMKCIDDSASAIIQQARQEAESTALKTCAIRNHQELKQALADCLKKHRAPPPAPPVVLLRLNPVIQCDRQEEAKSLVDVLDQTSFGHKGGIAEVTWRARSGNTNVSQFYSCCGHSVERFGVNPTSTCPRSDWLNRDTVHPGTLTLHSSRRSGGGVGPRGRFDHLPASKLPTWSCCRQASTAAGCKPLQVRSSAVAHASKMGPSM